jgi:hypothetical protein
VLFAGCEVASSRHFDGFKKAVTGLEPAAGTDSGADVLADEVPTVKKLARRDGRGITRPGLAVQLYRALLARVMFRPVLLGVVMRAEIVDIFVNVII